MPPGTRPAALSARPGPNEPRRRARFPRWPVAGTPSASDGRIAAWVTAAVGLAVLVLAVLYFLQTRDIAVLVVGGALAVSVGVLGWVWQDARELGLPTRPWLLVVFLAPVLGLGAYLLARELRGQGEPG